MEHGFTDTPPVLSDEIKCSTWNMKFKTVITSKELNVPRGTWR
jgi:hypothetical protein